MIKYVKITTSVKENWKKEVSLSPGDGTVELLAADGLLVPLALVQTRLQPQASMISKQSSSDRIAAVDPNMANVFKRILKLRGCTGTSRSASSRYRRPSRSAV